MVAEGANPLTGYNENSYGVKADPFGKISTLGIYLPEASLCQEGGQSNRAAWPCMYTHGHCRGDEIPDAHCLCVVHVVHGNHLAYKARRREKWFQKACEGHRQGTEEKSIFITKCSALLPAGSINTPPK